MNIQDLIRENISQVQPYSSARDEFNKTSDDMVFLDANENPFNSGLNRYPDPQQNKLKESISALKGIPKNQILIGNGSDEVLDLIFRVFCNPHKDLVITLPPTYGMYEVLANVNAVGVNKIVLSEDFQPKVTEILKAAKKNTKILFLCSPNNPSANSFNANKVEELLKQFNGIVVIDEAYIDFSERESWLTRLEDFPNLIVTQTLSKAYGMAGIRLGICYASQYIIGLLNKIKPPYNINTLSQQKALEQLEKTTKLKKHVQKIKSQRVMLIEELNKLSFVEKIYPSDANFLLVKVDDANLRYRQLINKGVVVRNRTSQALCTDCLRITVGTKKDNTKLLNALNSL
jgi:histidinol-phosphate aminotransferase